MKCCPSLLAAACCVPLLQACSLPPSSSDTAIRVEPVMAVRHSQPSLAIWYSLGRRYQESKRLDLAADAYRHVLLHDGAHADARNALATIHLAEGRLDEAVAAFLAVLETHPRLAYVHNNLGYAYFLKKEYALAVASLRRALELEPRHARASGNLALVTASIAGPGTGARMASTSQLPPEAVAGATATALPDPAAVAAHTVVAAPQPAAVTSASHTGERVQEAMATATTITIVNGTRDTRVAENLAAALQAQGYAVSAIVGLKPYTQRRNVIYYPPGRREEARALGGAMVTMPALVEHDDHGGKAGAPTIRLILGRKAAEAFPSSSVLASQ
ncbi:MAG TPA: tetratricopeptide repeat protein [Noviherbaspirillum sp.]|jgi:tetratricopeptide (TPR) repeat protein|uniref:LytR C-terminal domain-containing protein n=1 Tax=Noviherbaspirillum sp. TaxID=1926288 RepID=UPI002F94BF22